MKPDEKGFVKRNRSKKSRKNRTVVKRMTTPIFDLLPMEMQAAVQKLKSKKGARA